jgi:PhnB protein
MTHAPITIEIQPRLVIDEVVIPIQDRFYGKREGRVRDPFGHLWVLSRPIAKRRDEETQCRLEGAAQ